MSRVSGSKAELRYLNKVKDFSEQLVNFHKDSPQEGFAYFDSDEYKNAYGEDRLGLANKFFDAGIKNAIGMGKIFTKHMVRIMKGIDECFTDLTPYLNELDEFGKLNETNSLIESYPNSSLWDELVTYAQENWNIGIGFTEIPDIFVFKGKTVLFRYAIVCIQEMQKNKIDKAPELEAGEEVIKVYKELGLAVNDIARWLRTKHNIYCQSNHPLGGLVNTSPLAAKAGMGWQGHNGLLITPQYGSRQRIAPIFIANKIFEFTDSTEHNWIEQFCAKCRKCERSCPTQAIYNQRKVAATEIPTIGETRTCIDRTKCFPYFSKTLGCSICIKVCPFSQGNNAYNKIKQLYDVSERC